MARCGCTGGACTCVLMALDTDCVETNVTGIGSSDNPYIISSDLTIDPVTGNLLSCEEAGLRAVLALQDSNCIDFTGVGTPASPLIASLIFSPASSGCISCTPQGLRVNVSMAGGNQLSCASDGLFVAASTTCLPFITVAASDTQPEIQECANYICDGVNDELEIQAAIDLLGNFPAGTVILLPGTFSTSDTIFLDHGTTLEGTRGASIIDYDGSDWAVSNDIGGLGSGTEATTVQNLTIKGNDGGAVLFEFGTLNSVITNCILEAEGATLPTVSIHGQNIRVTNNYILADNDANGFAMSVLSFSDSNHIIANNNIYGPGGITLSDSDGTNISGNNIAASFTGASSGIHLTGGIGQAIISNNIIRDFGRQGVHVDSAEECSITNNLIMNCGQQTTNTYDGIFLEGGAIAGTVDQLNVQGNQIRGSDTRYGINVSGAGATDNLVTNNDLLFSGVTASFNNTGAGTIVTAGNRL